MTLKISDYTGPVPTFRRGRSTTPETNQIRDLLAASATTKTMKAIMGVEKEEERSRIITKLRAAGTRDGLSVSVSVVGTDIIVRATPKSKKVTEVTEVAEEFSAVVASGPAFQEAAQPAVKPVRKATRTSGGRASSSEEKSVASRTK